MPENVVVSETDCCFFVCLLGHGSLKASFVENMKFGC